jgi:hypothetical protein
MPPTDAPIPLLLWLAPLFALFEVWELVLAERYLGLKQFARAADPRELGPGEAVAFLSVMGIIFNWLFMLGLVASRFSRIEAAAMLAVSVLGLSVRRQLGGRWWRRFGVRWCLMVLTVEGAIRLGLLGLLWREAWKRW